MSKETKSLLEAAQSVILKEINARMNFIEKLFSAQDKSRLREAQSLIAKAINSLGKSESTESTGKLQTHLNEKSTKIKELETMLERSRDELDIIREKAKAYEVEIEKLKKAQPTTTVEETRPMVNSAELNQLNERCTKLSETNRDLEQRNNSLNTELKEAWDLSLEFNKRLKKLKSEILAS